MNTIYVPKGAAKEYGDYSLNIYTGCPHRCWYCFAPGVLHRDRNTFHTDVRPREGIVEATEGYLKSTKMTGKTVHLCFTCDPYPTGHDSSATREIIKLLKKYGNHVQILTKGSGMRDFDLLDGNDWYGVTLTGTEGTECRLISELKEAHDRGIRTWISFEPVLDAQGVLEQIRHTADFAGRVKIGKLNYHPSDIDWRQFGHDAEALCRKLGAEYYIKESLRREMSTSRS